MSEFSVAEVRDSIKEILINECVIDSELIKPEAGLIDDLGLDSMTAVSLLTSLEEKYSICLEDDLSELPETFADLVRFVSGKLTN